VFLLQALQKCGDAPLPFRIVRGQVHQHADAAHALALLRPRGERPRDRRAAEQGDELAPSHLLLAANGADGLRPRVTMRAGPLPADTRRSAIS